MKPSKEKTHDLLDFAKANKNFWLLSAVLLIFFAILIFLTPYLHDDWPWGSQIGDERIESWFEGYNGRYSGNLLVLLLTRSEFVQVITVSLSLLTFCFVPLLLLKKKAVMPLMLCAFLLLTMPRELFVQGVIWTSGYSNYFPPMLITLLYFCIVQEYLEDIHPSYSTKKHVIVSALTLVMGFIGSMFMENVTIYNVIAAFAVLVLVFIKHKKVFPIHISFFVGCIVGAICMFTNSAYSNVANDTDFYRSFLSWENIGVIMEHIDLIFVQLFCKAFPLLILISSACVIMTAKSIMNTSAQSKAIKVGFGCIVTNAISLLILLAKGLFPNWNIIYGNKIASIAVITLFALLWCFSVLFMVIFNVKDGVLKTKMLLLILSVPVMVAPLAVVNPLNSRCLTPAYLTLAVFCVVLVDGVFDKLPIVEAAKKIFSVVLLCSVGALFIVYISIYASVRNYEIMRIEYLEKQIEAGEQNELICSRLPYATGEYFVYTDKPIDKNWEWRFKCFYKLDTKASIKFVSVEEFDKWRLEFDSKQQQNSDN